MNQTHSLTPPRGLDHIVIAAADLDALAERYRRLGFQVGPRNRHPWGTQNHIVQFPGCFLELIGVADPALIPPREGRRYSFGAFVCDFIAGGDGAAMLALESHNAIADADAFRRARMGDFESFHFERDALGPDGGRHRIAFTLAFAELAGAPRAGFFTCQQHQPQHFWSEARKLHPNGVRTLASVILVCDDPSDVHEFLGHFVNQREMRATSFGLELDTGRGLIEVLSPEAFAYRFGRAAPTKPGQGPQIAALEFRLAPGAGLDSAGSAAVQVDGRKVIFEADAGGLVLAFA